MAVPEPARSAPDTSGVRVPPPLYYVAGFLAGVAIEAAVPIDRPAALVTVVGAALGLGAWLYFDGTATFLFARAGTSMIPMRPSTALVTDGPYRFTRNPMYVGMACAYVGLAFLLGLVWPLATLPFVIFAIDRLVIAREEPYLLQRFGEPYREFTRRVRRWI